MWGMNKMVGGGMDGWRQWTMERNARRDEGGSGEVVGELFGGDGGKFCGVD